MAGWYAAGTIPAAAIPAMPAVALEQPASCPAAEIIGVHGTSEGPSSTNPHDSPEIKATFRTFTADEQKLGKHGARLEYYPYPTLGFADYMPTDWPELAIAIDGYADELEAELESFSHACPGTPISLVGYSLGALLINNMLSFHHTEWSFIDAVDMFRSRNIVGRGAETGRMSIRLPSGTSLSRSQANSGCPVSFRSRSSRWSMMARMSQPPIS